MSWIDMRQERPEKGEWCLFAICEGVDSSGEDDYYYFVGCVTEWDNKKYIDAKDETRRI